MRSFFSNPPTVFSGPEDLLPEIGADPGTGPEPPLASISLSRQLFSVALDGANPIERDVVPRLGVVMGAGPAAAAAAAVVVLVTWGDDGMGDGTDISSVFLVYACV